MEKHRQPGRARSLTERPVTRHLFNSEQKVNKSCGEYSKLSNRMTEQKKKELTKLTLSPVTPKEKCMHLTSKGRIVRAVQKLKDRLLTTTKSTRMINRLQWWWDAHFWKGIWQFSSWVLELLPSDYYGFWVALREAGWNRVCGGPHSGWYIFKLAMGWGKKSTKTVTRDK